MRSRRGDPASYSGEQQQVRASRQSGRCHARGSGVGGNGWWCKRTLTRHYSGEREVDTYYMPNHIVWFHVKMLQEAGRSYIPTYGVIGSLVLTTQCILPESPTAVVLTTNESTCRNSF